MKLQLYAGYIADTSLYKEWCIERAKTDPLFAKCFEDCLGFGEFAMENYAKKKQASWRKRLSVNYLPYQINECGDIDDSKEHTMFAFREYDYTGFLADFCRWDLFQETDADRECKAQIEELGIILGPWTTVSFVGKQSIFCDFSPEVVSAILERMKAKYEKIQEKRAQRAQAASVKPPRKKVKRKTDSTKMEINQVPTVAE